VRVVAGIEISSLRECVGFKYNPTLIFDLARTTTSMGMGSVGGNDYL
jgi:hypothetical protein